MADTKTQRSTPKKQSANSNQLSAKTKELKQRPQIPSTSDRRFIEFPEAKGKRVESVELLTAPDYHSLTINFKGKTALLFQVETGFTVRTEYSDWKTGEQRIVRKWPLIKSQPKAKHL
jgi:hypothetical protein